MSVVRQEDNWISQSQAVLTLLVTLSTGMAGRMSLYGKSLVFQRKLSSRGPGPESYDMEVPTRGAACRCASVSDGFLHRNRVLSVPSQPHLAVVLSKRTQF